MGGSQSSQQTIDQKLESVIENKCGSVVCKNVQNITLEAGDGGKITGIKAKQKCAAKLACAFDSLVDQAAQAELAAKLKQGAGAVSGQDSIQNIKQSISARVTTDCGSSESINIMNQAYKTGKNGEISNIEFDQAGTAALECGAKALLKQGSEGKGKTDMDQGGLMDGINALLKSFGMVWIIAIIGVILLLVLFGPQLISAFAPSEQ
jgi:hypothetical protein